MLKACIYTLGCRVNQYESDAIMQELQRDGISIVNTDTECHICIINTCSVTGESDRKSKQIIRRLSKKNPNAVIVVTGCFAELNPQIASKIPGVDLVCGNNAKSQIARLVKELAYKKSTECQLHMPSIYDGRFDVMSAGAPLNRTRAFIKIQDGCDSKCAYCIIPFARGSVRSNTRENILREARQIVAEGCREIVFTGIETASYGKDLKNGYSLGDLLTEASQIEGLERMRLGSLDPSQITREFVDKISALHKIMPHFHISMQSGCSQTLREMKRKYNIEMAKERLDYLRAKIPNVKFSADVITGFPGESDENFQETLEFFKEQKFLHLHIFPYSKREGTLAATMDNQVPEQTKKERLHLLEKQQAEIKAELLRELCEKSPYSEVLFETYDGEYILGHTPEFVEVKVKSCYPHGNELLRVKPTHSDGDYIYGELV